MRFEVSYKTLARGLSESGGVIHGTDGPSNYVVVVEAPNQDYAEHQVRNMNGGADRCIIQYARHIG
jgi:hypothetical protein